MVVPGEPLCEEHSINGDPPQKRPVLVWPASGPLVVDAHKEGLQIMIAQSGSIHMGRDGLTNSV